MSLHHLTVALLTELSPAEYTQISPNRLLGLNENKGEAIKLRIRTDKMDGFRNYADVRRTLCHELTHNVWGDHDDNVRCVLSFIFQLALPQAYVFINSLKR